jgi:hypothetical protein
MDDAAGLSAISLLAEFATAAIAATGGIFTSNMSRPLTFPFMFLSFQRLTRWYIPLLLHVALVDSIATLTGTSMASPNVAGTLLLLQQHQNNLTTRLIVIMTKVDVMICKLLIQYHV